MELEKLRDALKIVNAREYALIEESLVSVYEVGTGRGVVGRIKGKRRSNPPFC